MAGIEELKRQYRDCSVTPNTSYLEAPDMSMNGDVEHISLSVLDEIEHIQSSVCAQMETLSYSKRDIFCVRLALDETLTNAIRHGHDMDPSKEVRISFLVADQHVWIQVEDQGKGFRLEEIPDPTEPEYIERPNGRGLHVIRSFMCSVQYNDRGNQVTMLKNRS